VSKQVQTKKIALFFKNYLTSFKHYDLINITACYHLPCTLHTPDQIMLLKSMEACQQELSNIFNQLKQEEISNIIAKKASYSVITDDVFLVNIDWEFLDGQGEVFTDFCAIYHLILIDNELKIINIVSHDLSNSQSLDYPFILID
jgi:hypothetical protein